MSEFTEFRKNTFSEKLCYLWLKVRQHEFSRGFRHG